MTDSVKSILTGVKDDKIVLLNLRALAITKAQTDVGQLQNEYNSLLSEVKDLINDLGVETVQIDPKSMVVSVANIQIIDQVQAAQPIGP